MTILELREKRAKAWEAAKAFLDSHRNEKGVLSAEDDAAYTRMEQEITDLGKEIARMERQEAFERELSQPVNTPLTGRPASGGAGKEKTGRASEEYRTNFWNAMRSKVPLPGVVNALEEGTDSEGGYLVPDEYERTLVEALEEENVFRQLANVIRTSSGDRKIPVVATKGTASWIDEEGAYTESDDSFGQVSIGAYKVGTMIKVSEELLNDSVFDLESYIAKEFARRIGAKEEEAFFTGDGSGKPLGVLAATGGAETGVTAASSTAITADELMDLFYSLKSPYRKKGGMGAERFHHQGGAQAEGFHGAVPVAAVPDGRYAGYPAWQAGEDLRLYAGDRGGGEDHCLRRFQLLLDRGPAGTFLQAAERTVCRQRPGGLPWLPEGGWEAGAVRGGEGAGAEGQRLSI